MAISLDELQELTQEIPEMKHTELVWLVAFFAGKNLSEYREARKTYRDLNPDKMY